MSAALMETELTKRMARILANDSENGEDMYPTIIELVMEDINEDVPTDAESVRPTHIHTHPSIHSFIQTTNE